MMSNTAATFWLQRRQSSVRGCVDVHPSTCGRHHRNRLDWRHQRAADLGLPADPLNNHATTPPISQHRGHHQRVHHRGHQLKVLVVPPTPPSPSYHSCRQSQLSTVAWPGGCSMPQADSEARRFAARHVTLAIVMDVSPPRSGSVSPSLMYRKRAHVRCCACSTPRVALLGPTFGCNEFEVQVRGGPARAKNWHAVVVWCRSN